MNHSASLLRHGALIVAFILLSVSCSHRIPDTKKGITDAFIAAHGER